MRIPRWSILPIKVYYAIFIILSNCHVVAGLELSQNTSTRLEDTTSAVSSSTTSITSSTKSTISKTKTNTATTTKVTPLAAIRGGAGAEDAPGRMATCPPVGTWGHSCHMDCYNTNDCEGNLICCSSSCGRHCVSRDYVPPPGTVGKKASPETGNDQGGNPVSSTTSSAWQYYVGAGVGAIVLIAIISSLVIVAMRRKKSSKRKAPREVHSNVLTEPPPPPPPKLPKQANEDREEVYCYIDESDLPPEEMAPGFPGITVTPIHVRARYDPEVDFDRESNVESGNDDNDRQGPVIHDVTDTYLTSPSLLPRLSSPPDVVMSSPPVMAPVIVEDPESGAQYTAMAFTDGSGGVEGSGGARLMSHQEWSQLDFSQEGWVGLFTPGVEQGTAVSNLYVPS